MFTIPNLDHAYLMINFLGELFQYVVEYSFVANFVYLKTVSKRSFKPQS